MTQLETIDFESKEKLFQAIETMLEGKEAYRTYQTKTGENKTVKIISKGRMYIGNNYSIGANESTTGKFYLSVNYLSVDDRKAIAKHNNEATSDEDLQMLFDQFKHVRN